MFFTRSRDWGKNACRGPHVVI